MTEMNDFEFRSLTWNDIDTLKKLQSDLFPVQYPDSFYRKLTLEDRYISILAWATRKNISSSSCSGSSTPISSSSSSTTTTSLIDDHNHSGGSSLYNGEIPPPTSPFSPLSPLSSSSSIMTTTSRFYHSDSNKIFQQELIGVVTARIDVETGLCSLFFENIEGYIMTFGVKQEYRKKGIGLKLLNNISEQLKKRRCNRITLHVKSINRDAYSFYIKNGFQVEETMENYYTIAKVKYNALRMVKPIENNGNNWNKWFKMLSLSDPNKDDDDDDDYDYNPPPSSSSMHQELSVDFNNSGDLNYRYSNYYKSLLEENNNNNNIIDNNNNNNNLHNSNNLN